MITKKPRSDNRKRKLAIRRAERKINKYIDELRDAGHPIIGEKIADYYQEIKARELKAVGLGKGGRG